MKRMKPRSNLVSTKVAKVGFVLSDHFLLRLKEHYPDSCGFPKTGSFVRLVTMMDTLRHHDITVLKISGGGTAIVRWLDKDTLIVVTVLSKKDFNRDQLQSVSRFMPISTVCVEVGRIKR